MRFGLGNRFLAVAEPVLACSIFRAVATAVLKSSPAGLTVRLPVFRFPIPKVEAEGIFGLFPRPLLLWKGFQAVAVAFRDSGKIATLASIVSGSPKP